MSHFVRFSFGCVVLAPLFLSGCATNTGTGTVVGGEGAGVGALVGSATGHAGAGAAIGAGVGATGAVVGNSVNEQQKRDQDRAVIQAQYAQRMTKEEVINMSLSHVDEGLIINQIHARGMAYPLSSDDVIMLQTTYKISLPVIAAMQQMSPPPVVLVEREPSPVIVGGYYYGRPYRRW